MPGRDAGRQPRALAERAVEGELALERGQAVAEAAQAGADVELGAADAVVGDLDLDLARRRRTLTFAVVALAYLITLVSPSATTKYAAASTGAGSRSSTSRSHSTAIGTRSTSTWMAGASPWSESTAGWMPRASSRSSASAAASLSASSSTVAGQLGVLLEPGAQQAQVERERDELLLGAVVQVALDLAAGVVGRLDDPAPRVAQLLEPGPQVGLQALVVDRQRGSRGRGVHELGRGVELGVVHDRRHPRALALDRRPGASRAGARQVHAMPAVVHEHLAVGEPVGDVQRAVAEALGQHLAHRLLSRALGAQQRLGEGPQQPADAVLRGHGEHADRRRQHAQRDRE